ncbi:MAG TPA: hypothetical protein VGI48_10075 [Caldimonas sp.]|jgi:hypothetical protein
MQKVARPRGPVVGVREAAAFVACGLVVLGADPASAQSGDSAPGAPAPATAAGADRLSDVQSAVVSIKLIIDAYGLWTFNPALALRVSFSNLDPRAYVTGGAVDGPDFFGVPVRETSETRAPTFINVQLRLEMKL